MVDYSEIVKPYLNTTPELDDAIFKLWGHWNDGKVDVNSSMREFFKACSVSPNIGKFEHYVPHCLQVARRCGEAGKKVSGNYGFLEGELKSEQMEFKGLIKDSFYLIGGNGKNNENGEDSNFFHEILTYAQMRHMGLEELARGMAMHGIASEILEVEQIKGRFTEITAPERNVSLDILKGIDFLCTRDYLPDTYGSYENSFNYRVREIRARRTSDHPLIVGLNNGGEEKLLEILEIIKKLEEEKMSSEEVKDFYNK